MKDLFKACAQLFDKSPQPFGIARVYVDDKGNPYDFSYEYLNPAMAAMTDQKVEELQGQAVYQMWPGGDPTWLNYFCRAAYHDEANEFESVSVILEQFLDIVVFPIVVGYCGFLIQDVTSWMGRAHLTMENASAGLFFYDMRTHLLLLTKAARERCGLDVAYLSIEEFTERVFHNDFGAEIRRQVASFWQSKGSVLYEARLPNGNWLRLSLTHTGQSDRFAYGFLEDITRTKVAELHSARQMEIINSLSRENFALYLVDLDKNHIVPYRVSDRLMGVLSDMGDEGMPYTEFVEVYTENYIAEADRAAVKAEISPEVVLDRMRADEQDFSLSYRRIFEGDPQFVELRVFRLPGEGYRAVFAGRNINEEVLDQLQQKEALQDALNLAEHASSAKSTFLTNMSHDFRTPMNSITGFAGLALEHLNEPDRVRDCLNKIILASEHLINLVNDILDVSRIESGKISFTEDTVDLEEFARSMGTMFAEQAARRRLTLSVDTAGLRHPLVASDRLRLNQIVLNTVGNALKFTPEGGHVALKITERKSTSTGYGTYVIIVRDDGYGMSSDFLDRLFLPFERDTVGAKASTEGTGLGMTITKSLVDLMGGTIDVSSAVGKGTEFIIALPLKRVSGIDTSTTVAPESTHHKNRRRYDGYRALVVDDDDLSREIMTAILQEHGIVSEEAADGYEAISLVEASEPHHFDVVIMDMRMPRMSGDEATRAIRLLDREDAQTLPIIATTADAFEEGFRRARDAGMTAHLTKPLDVNNLLDVLDVYLPPKEGSSVAN